MVWIYEEYFCILRALKATYLNLPNICNLKILDAGDITNTGVVLDDPNSTASSDLSLSNSKTTEPREDPEVIKQWKENQIQLLQNKDKEEEKEKELLKEQAKKELEDWYKQHSEQV